MRHGGFVPAAGARICASRKTSIISTVTASMIAAWLAIIAPAAAFQAAAAQVDAVGAPAPVSFADIIEKVKATVVGVRVKVEEQGAGNADRQELPVKPGTPFGEFFRRFGIPLPQTPSPKFETALGSGFFISGDGYIVTNNHVVAHGKSFEVITDDGKTYPAKVIGTDPLTDVALIKVAASRDFPYVKFAETEPRIGDWVLAVGNPFGLGGTVTAGIVSARGRNIGEGPYEEFIQIDAPVNKGNSGGPTFNVKGEVIGVNTAIYSPSGGFVGVAFDIPAATVKLVAQQLKEKGHVTRGWIGVEIQKVTPTIAEAIGLKKAAGALVTKVNKESPASKAGVEAGDVITALNSQPVEDPGDLARKIAAIAPGTSVTFGVFRNGQEKSLAVILGQLPPSVEKPAPQKPEAPREQSSIGLTLVPAGTIAGAGEHGLLVIGVNPRGPAADSGVQVGDLILSVGGHPVETVDDVNKLVAEAHSQSKRAILLRIKRDDTTIFVAIPIG